MGTSQLMRLRFRTQKEQGVAPLSTLTLRVYLVSTLTLRVYLAAPEMRAGAPSKLSRPWTEIDDTRASVSVNRKQESAPADLKAAPEVGGTGLWFGRGTKDIFQTYASRLKISIEPEPHRIPATWAGLQLGPAWIPKSAKAICLRRHSGAAVAIRYCVKSPFVRPYRTTGKPFVAPPVFDLDQCRWQMPA